MSARIALRTPTGGQVLGFGVLAHGSDVWVWGPSDVLRIDARANRAAQRIVVGDAHGELTGLAPRGRQLLVTTADGHLIRFDARTGAPLASAAVSLPASAVRWGGGRLAVVAARGTLAGVDPTTGRLARRRPLGFRVGAVIHAGGLLWANGAAVNDPGDRVSAVDPATGRSPARSWRRSARPASKPSAACSGSPAADGRVPVARPSLTP